MLWIGVGILIVISVGIIVYPLFFKSLEEHIQSVSTEDVSQKDSLLSALSELEEDYQLGKISKEDFQRLQLHFQRQYLKEK